MRLEVRGCLLKRGAKLQAWEGCAPSCAFRRGTDGLLFQNYLFRMFALQTALEAGDRVSPVEDRFVRCPV